ncbi:hypothetical protein [Cellulomonas soli]|uniref:Uncharacterized protein n=1 Tax=Cellulomonas soli TaxID=931535 RepID=A0A512PDS7_9CELL|nr:hypothetical protein [Cellulomonas soli]NYI59146.1 hypothetical protein [Cellulomonas soli]GEP69361.1 hypothetical protein CSO01_20760 [Cellulomonas soli]
MNASTWEPGTVATVEVAMHEGRYAAEALAVAVVLDQADDSGGESRYLFLDVAPDSTWAPILAAAASALREAGCPAGAVTWAGQPERLVEDCGCSWISRELALPTAGDTETYEGARR